MFRLQIMLVFMASSYLSFSQTDYSIKNISSELLKNANSVLIDEYIEVDVSEEKKLICTRHQALTVLNKKGNQYADLYIPYSDVTRIKAAEVFIFDAKGNEIQHYKKRDFKDVSAVGGGTLYSNYRALVLDYSPAAYPYTVVFNYKYERSSTAFVPGWYPMGGYVSSTKKSTYKIIFNPNNKPRYQASNLERQDISISENFDNFIFEAANIKAIKYEELSPTFDKIGPRVVFALNRFNLNGVVGSAENWKEFGKWRYDNLIRGLDNVSIGTAKKIEQLVFGVEDEKEKVRLIYNYVQNKTRYISVQLGIGGWKPYPAEQVDKLAYGDCKGLTNYTKALLKTQGIDSYYTVVWSGTPAKNFEKNFASMQGDHVILNVPLEEESVWLECTDQDIPFGYLGSFTDDRDVLVITPEGGKIMHTKVYPDEDNLQEYNATLRLKENGAIEGSFEGKYQGLQYDGKYRWNKKTNEELTTAYKERWSYINGLSIENVILDDNRKEIVFTEKLQIKTPNFATKIGNDLLLCANVFNQSQYIPPRIIDRKQDLYISEGYKDIDVLEIIIPNNYFIDSLPEDTTIETKFGQYSISFSEVSKNKIEYTRNLLIRKDTFPPKEYDAYRSFRKKIAKLDKSKILLKLRTQ